MLYITGRISDKKIVERTEINSPVNITDYKSAIAKNNDGVSSDFSIFAVEDASVCEKIQLGYEWSAVWDGSEIVDIDFSSFEAKNLLSFSCTKEEILADGVAKTEIYIKMVDPSEVDVNKINEDIYIQVASPSGTVKKKVSILDGVASFTFKTTTPGKWTIPANINSTIGEYRIKNNIIIDALLA